MNIQLIEKLSHPNDGMLDVHSIFFTIQGEGPFTGHPAIFVRLAGCNLQCPKCDTDYTSKRERMRYLDILAQVQKLTPKSYHNHKRMLIVITGGEPLRQEVHHLLNLVDYTNYFVQIETNGTLPFLTGRFPYLNNIAHRQGVYVVVSPKTSRVQASVAQIACAWKYVASEQSLYQSEDGLPFHALGMDNYILARPTHSCRAENIYLQPQDDKDEVQNRMNIQACVESCQKHGHIFQLQTHKYMGVE